jgi:predicted anti-sigma-YlaC factor YlaD
MKCVREDLKALITDVLVGEAETSVREQVLSHLETCASCREDRDAMARLLGLLKEAAPWAGATVSADDDALQLVWIRRLCRGHDASVF